MGGWAGQNRVYTVEIGVGEFKESFLEEVDFEQGLEGQRFLSWRKGQGGHADEEALKCGLCGQQQALAPGHSGALLA